LLATGVLAVAISPFAVAKSGDFLREGKRNGTTTKETQIISRVAAGSGPTGGYSTRQSNLSSSGGGAAYGCRASSASTSKPCIRASNLSTGRAFEFNVVKGSVAGVITAGSGGDTKKPLTTNATGVATGLNADRVDGKDASAIVTDAAARNSFAQVTTGGTAAETRGVATNGVSDLPAGAGTYTVVFNGDLSACALSATVIGTTPGQVTVTPAVAADKTTTTVDVRTFDGGGAPEDHGFHLTSIC
jgi:hypothetical protein